MPPAEPTPTPAPKLPTKKRLTLTQTGTHSWRIHLERPIKIGTDGQPQYATITNHQWHKHASYDRATEADALAYLAKSYGYNSETGTLNGSEIDLFTHPLPDETKDEG